MANGTFGIKQFITQTGVLAPDVDIITDTHIRLVTTNAGISNEITLYGRLGGQSNWDIIDTLVGSNSKTFDVSLYDFVRLECTNFSALGSRVDLTGSGFALSGGLNTIITPNGELATVSDLEFTSSDNSIAITAIAPNIIDIKTSLTPVAKYVKTALLTDWVGPSSNEYTLTIPFSSHTITNPTVNCYISNGLGFDVIATPVYVDENNNVILTVSQTPDTRFIGKIVLE